jgi:hypothetical protein
MISLGFNFSNEIYFKEDGMNYVLGRFKQYDDH